MTLSSLRVELVGGAIADTSGKEFALCVVVPLSVGNEFALCDVENSLCVGNEFALCDVEVSLCVGKEFALCGGRKIVLPEREVLLFIQ